jgi:hypothetical protein
MAHTPIHHLWNYLLKLNLFEKPSSTPQTKPKECLTTRIDLASFITFLFIIAFSLTLLVRTVDRVESSPSPAQFLHLSLLYANTLQYPCSKFGIDHSSFVTIHARFHQVCFSHFVQQTWIRSIFERHSTDALVLLADHRWSVCDE